MNIDQCLQKLKCGPYSSLEEIKASYKRLSKELHPDLHPELGNKPFVELTEAYNFLVAYYKPKAKPIDKIDTARKYFFIFDDHTKTEYDVEIDEKTIDENISLYIMIQDKEFRVVLPKGLVLPAKLKITNVFTRAFDLNVRTKERKPAGR